MQQQVDKDLVKDRFAFSLSTYNKEAIVQKTMAIELTEMIKNEIANCQIAVFEAGCGSGMLTSHILSRFNIISYTANDLVPSCDKTVQKLNEKYHIEDFSFISGDVETLDIKKKYDLFTGNAVFQWLADPVSFWRKTISVLNPDGIVGITLFGQDNFKEIRDLTGFTLNYPNLELLHSIFSVNYNIIKLCTTHNTLWFNSGRDVLRHIRHTGTGGLAKEQWNKNKLLNFEKIYKEKYSDNQGRISLTYQPIYLIAKKKS